MLLPRIPRTPPSWYSSFVILLSDTVYLNRGVAASWWSAKEKNCMSPRRTRKPIIYALAIPAMVLAGTWMTASSCHADPSTAASAAVSSSAHDALLDMQDAFVQIAQSVEPMVVNIKAEHMRGPDPTDPGGGDDTPTPPAPKDKGGKAPAVPDVPLIPRPERRFEDTGSGVIVRSDGYILTNDHVVTGADDGIVTVTLSDGREFKGKVFSDFRSDLAVVKIDPGTTPLPAATFADSTRVRPGQWAIAVGSPFDLANTLTVGVISAIERHQFIDGGEQESSRYYPELIQTDAAINPGNSGGPLFNIDGQVVGINVAIDSPVEGSAGVGFSIPSDIALSIMHKLITTGSVTRGYLGIAPYDMTPALAAEYNTPTGAFIRDVNLSSPASEAGLQASDIITGFDKTPITGEVSLRSAIAEAAPGTKVRIAYMRDGVPAVTTATISATPPDQEEMSERPQPAVVAQEKPTLGVVVRDLDAQKRQELGLPSSTQGVYVDHVNPGGHAEEAFEMYEVPSAGAVIQKIGKFTIHHPADIDAALAASPDRSQVTVVVLCSVGNEMHQKAISIGL
jgi:serine protease Do